jgi:hypothetical protein
MTVFVSMLIGVYAALKGANCPDCETVPNPPAEDASKMSIFLCQSLVFIALALRYVHLRRGTADE